MATKFIVPVDGVYNIKGEYYVNTIDCETLIKMKFNGLVWYPDGSICYDIDEEDCCRILKHADIVNVYNSEEDYVKRRCLSKEVIKDSMWLNLGKFSSRASFETDSDGNNVVGVKAYVFKDNEPKLEDVDMKSITTINGRAFYGITDMVYYKSQEICLACNDYSVTDEKGERIVRSPYKKLALNEEQNRDFEVFKSSFNSLKERGVKIYFDTENMEFLFINMCEVKQQTYTDNSDFEEDMTVIDLNNPIVTVESFDISTICSDWLPAVRFKD